MRYTTILAAALAIGLSCPAVAGEVPKPVERAGGGYNPVPPAEGYRYPDCFCTDSQGVRVEIGKTACLRVDSQEVLAQCDMSLNNPIWRRVQEGCPTS
jgi:hypothetical protein